MEPTIQRIVSANDIPSLHQILIACGLDLKERFDLSHWMPGVYSLESMLKDAMSLEVYALTIGEAQVGTFMLETTSSVPLSYIKYGSIRWQVKDASAVYVHKLAVLPAWQGQGLGTWCLRTIERLAGQRDCNTVRLDAVKTHPRLLSFYASQGYQQVGELIYNSDLWVDAFVFEKVLMPDGFEILV
ncbi:MAG: GNAT family N-acetyltransferase [Chroococcidiopsidaceae cyanobacterium CP_BM_ER_R8_30]|nr:GNAT family N-acetyltransferase [Chroococcidiopsidaceae cyanobacterium CP_BM_ER_R8_30]